jgi:hypothetical protein
MTADFRSQIITRKQSWAAAKLFGTANPQAPPDDPGTPPPPPPRPARIPAGPRGTVPVTDPIRAALARSRRYH